MASIGSYSTTAFSEDKKFLVLDPATQSAALVSGADLVGYITPSLTQVFTETTRAAALTTDYQIGQFVQTAGATAIDDGGNGLYIVVAGGDGDYAMMNGNDLLLLPFGSLAGSNLDGALVTDDGTQIVIEDAIALRPVQYGSMEAVRLSTTSYDYIETTSFYAGGSTGGAKLYRDGTGTPTGSGAAVIAAALAAGTFCNAAGVCYKLRRDQDKTPSIFGATGGADDAAFLQAWATFGGDLEMDRDYNSSATLTISVARTTINGRAFKLTIDDAAVTGITINAQGVIIHGLWAWGTDTSTPSIDMITVNGSAGSYATIMSCNIAYASKGIEAASGSYIIKSLSNTFSNCYYYEHLTAATDFNTSGCTFGTSTFLTAAIFGTGACAGHSINGNYFETESRSWSVQVGSSCAFWNISDNILNGSGGVLADAPVVIATNQWNGGRPDTTYASIIRLATNADESSVVGNKLTAYYSKGGTPSAGTAISSTVSHCTIGLNQIRYFDKGIVTTGSYHSVSANKVRYCGYGMQFNSASDYCMLSGNNVTDSDTRDYDIQSGTHTVCHFDNYGTVLGLSKRKGTTANRPVLDAGQIGYFYLDTTLDADGKPIWWNATAWVDATGATV